MLVFMAWANSNLAKHRRRLRELIPRRPKKTAHGASLTLPPLRPRGSDHVEVGCQWDSGRLRGPHILRWQQGRAVARAALHRHGDGKRESRPQNALAAHIGMQRAFASERARPSSMILTRRAENNLAGSPRSDIQLKNVEQPQMSCEVSMMTAHATNSIRMPTFALPNGPI
jgi:hypothetical protein